MPRPIGYAMRNVTSAARHAAIPGPAGEVKLRIPKLRAQTFETAIIERYRRRESSVEEALIEMYLAGVSVRRVEDITEALWGTPVSPATVSDLNKKIYGTTETWRNRPIEGDHSYVYLDGIVLKRSWAGEVRNVSLLVAIGVNGEGYREIWHLRSRQRGQGGLERLPRASQGTWPARCPTNHLGRPHGAIAKHCGVLPRCRLATGEGDCVMISIIPALDYRRTPTSAGGLLSG
jgi:hypothetical protein